MKQKNYTFQPVLFESVTLRYWDQTRPPPHPRSGAFWFMCYCAQLLSYFDSFLVLELNANLPLNDHRHTGSRRWAEPFQEFSFGHIYHIGAVLVAQVAELHRSVVSLPLCWPLRCQLTWTATEIELRDALTDPPTAVTVPLIRSVFPPTYSISVLWTGSLIDWLESRSAAINPRAIKA